MTTMNNIIKDRRKALGITQKELADTLSISDKTVSRWESGNQIPDAILLPDLAEALGISINELYGYKSEWEEKEEVLPACHNPASKWIEPLNNAYKISIALGLVLFVFGAMLMIHINSFFIMSPTGNKWQNGNVFIFSGAGLCLASQITYMILCRQKSFGFNRSEIMYGGISALGVLAILQIVFPVCVTVHITYTYEIIIGLLSVAVTVMMIFQKRSLRRLDIKVGKSITIASVAVVSLCLLTMLGVFIYLKFFNERAVLDELLVYLGAIGQVETFEHRLLQYSFYALQLPMLSSLLMNFIHLLVKSRKL